MKKLTVLTFVALGLIILWVLIAPALIHEMKQQEKELSHG